MKPLQLAFILPFSKKHGENGRINFQLLFILPFSKRNIGKMGG
jgi:hypothetical protein